MVLFLLTFFAVYGSVHVYAFLKARAGLGFGWGTGALVVIWMVLMTTAPVLVRLSERAGFDRVARLLAYIGYNWMGLLFLFFSAALLFDIIRLVLYLAGAVLPLPVPQISRHAAFIVPLVLAFIIMVYGSFEAGRIRTEVFTIETSKISPAVGRVRIVQISDVHVGLIVREKRLQKIVAQVVEARPDVIVSTGDLVDGQMDDLAGLAEMLNSVKAQYGKYAVTGNHEFYAGLRHSLSFTNQSGFTLLRNEGHELPIGITIVGVDDPTGEAMGAAKPVAEKRLLSGRNPGTFTILLKHRPAVDVASRGLFDLQLSGHVHKGQIFPFNLLTRLAYPQPVATLVRDKGSYLYVSPGSGTWGPPIRFLAPPEVTVIDLVYGAP